MIVEPSTASNGSASRPWCTASARAPMAQTPWGIYSMSTARSMALMSGGGTYSTAEPSTASVRPARRRCCTASARAPVRAPTACDLAGALGQRGTRACFTAADCPSAARTAAPDPVYSINESGIETVLHSFGSGSDGLYPYAGLLNVKCTLYGTTEQGGAHGCGTVYSVSTTGAERVLHSFGCAGSGSGWHVPLRELAQRERQALRHDCLRRRVQQRNGFQHQYERHPDVYGAAQLRFGLRRIRASLRA